MVDVSIGNETSPEANWNRQTDGQADRQASRQAGKPMCREAAPPKSRIISILSKPIIIVLLLILHLGQNKNKDPEQN